LNINLRRGRREYRIHKESEETMAEKELKTAHELAALILEQSRDFDVHSVKVVPDAKLGWVAVASSNNRFFRAENQEHVDSVARELRPRYDLKPGT
jgi:hypothetical protein